jgi:hypothetical protein
MAMTPNGDATIRVDLDSIEYLFTPPQPSPLEGRFESVAGIDRIEHCVRALPHSTRAEAVMVIGLAEVPPNQTDLEKRVATAIAGHCHARMADIDTDLKHTMHAGRDALWLGLGFLACCLALSSAGAAATTLPPLVQRLFSEGFMIAGWVALWRPIELLLYDSWPLRRDIRVLRAMADMPVTITSSSPATAAATAATAA